MSNGNLKSLIRLINFLTFIMGEKYRSEMLDKKLFKGYLKQIPNAKTPKDWLSHNEESVDKYVADPACNFIFTLNGFKTMAELLKSNQDTDRIQDIPKELPILITGGKEDPVSDYGDALEKLYGTYKNELQIENVDLKIYEGFRHELQQEIGREQVFEEQYEWIKKVLASGSED